MDDAEMMGLLQEVRARASRRALNQLLAGIRPELVGFLRHQLDSHPSSDALSEELAQETLLRAASSIGSCRAQNAVGFRSWLRTIARRVAKDRHRRRRRELERRAWEGSEELQERLTRRVFPQMNPDVQGDGPSRLDRVLGRLLWEAQDELSAGTQHVVYRKLMLNETWEETGRAVGTTKGGAKRRWQRAIPRLRTEVLQRIRCLPERVRHEILARLRGKGPSE